MKSPEGGVFDRNRDVNKDLRGSELAHEDLGPNALSLEAVPAYSRANSLPQDSCITLIA
ncbi:hypothetical protein IBA8401_30270 [Pseudomonas syringae]